ncbi:S24 family peptidase [Xanthomonas arboricola]|uniref:S24 family peptidase n=1 Tax=Xanthomonas arboricola TaxID=56448 RepID=UPI00182D178F|nr:S24 family peptidase [Xanthomonas arboricola]MBB5860214.1 phage repressor protein C with HTH and peptisase S24 domain [Xanthomonas arboricola]
MTTESPLVALRRARLQQWINEKHDGKQADFVRAAGINQGELSLLLKNKSFGEKRAAALERAAGMPSGYLSGSGPSQTHPVSPILETEKLVGDHVRVNQLDGDAGMGDGRINDDYPDVIKSMDFTPTYIRSVVGFVPQPGRLVLVTGRGDSMIPVIQPGESLMVDTGVTAFDGDGIYLINTGNGQQIKGLQDRGDAIYVVSANATLYPAFPMPRGAIVGGKVYLRNRIDRLN